MGMSGNYIAVYEEDLSQILSGEQDILDIDPEEYHMLDIDKSWHAIQFIFSGGTDEKLPHNFIVPLMVNTIEGEYDFGAFYLTKDQVREAYEVIRGIDSQSFKARYDFSSLLENQIYPLYEDEDAEEFFEYIYQHFCAIQNFFKETSNAHKCLIFYII